MTSPLQFYLGGRRLCGCPDGPPAAPWNKPCAPYPPGVPRPVGSIRNVVVSIPLSSLLIIVLLISQSLPEETRSGRWTGWLRQTFMGWRMADGTGLRRLTDSQRRMTMGYVPRLVILLFASDLIVSPR